MWIHLNISMMGKMRNLKRFCHHLDFYNILTFNHISQGVLVPHLWFRLCNTKVSNILKWYFPKFKIILFQSFRKYQNSKNNLFYYIWFYFKILNISQKLSLINIILKWMKIFIHWNHFLSWNILEYLCFKHFQFVWLDNYI